LILQFAWLNVIGLITYLVIKFIEFAGIGANSSSTINRKFEATNIVIHSIVFIIDVLLSVNILVSQIYLFNVFLSGFDHFLCIQIG
jgi:hypothetical protein